ncbi:MAG: phage tail sheath family protein [Acidobacteriia bacterium]|nr:phage tail sheath family protein [Terriglobia bacterium]
MPLQFRTPGVYIQEVSTGPRPIQPVGTSTAAFLGVAPSQNAHLKEAFAVNDWSQFEREFIGDEKQSTDLALAVYGFFLNGGSRCYIVNLGSDGTLEGTENPRSGLRLLEPLKEVAIVAAPGYTKAGDYAAVIAHCSNLKDRVAILDAPLTVPHTESLTVIATETGADKTPVPGSDKSALVGAKPSPTDFATFYFPGIGVRDPLAGPKESVVDTYPSGFVAGIWARTDAERGVQKAPANEVVRGALRLTYLVTHKEQEALNDAGVNVIRFFPREGIRVWGARTLEPDSDFKYLNVRRLFVMVEQSIANSLRWAVFEPNDESLWKSIARDATAFLTLLWRDGALLGATPEEAFFVKCDREVNTNELIDAGIVMCLIGIAAVKPAEFIVFRIGQHASGAQIETLMR